MFRELFPDKPIPKDMSKVNVLIVKELIQKKLLDEGKLIVYLYERNVMTDDGNASKDKTSKKGNILLAEPLSKSENKERTNNENNEVKGNEMREIHISHSTCVTHQAEG